MSRECYGERREPRGPQEAGQGVTTHLLRLPDLPVNLSCSALSDFTFFFFLLPKA